MKTSIPSLRFIFVLSLIFCGLGVIGALHAAGLSLAGSWRFELDPDNVGMGESWYGRDLTHTLRLPGALQNQGYGNDIRIDTPWTGDVNKDAWLNEAQYAPYRQPGQIKIPWALQPEKHYVGAAWYQKDFTVPKDWDGQRLVLTLERPHWETKVWLDGRYVGMENSLSTPHVYELGNQLMAGLHTLTIRVDNQVKIKVGDWAHSVTDHTQGNWNGLVGRMEIEPGPLIWFQDLRVFPDAGGRSIRVEGRIGNQTGLAGTSQLEIAVSSLATDNKASIPSVVTTHSEPVAWSTRGGQFSLSIDLPVNADLWDEFNPVLHELSASLTGLGATHRVRFGLRDIGVKNRMFTVNGRPTFLRGTLECSIFPLTGYPPTDVEAWKRLVRICQAHGLNHIRFHSWCPPEAAFVAADELGFYYHVECAAWTAVGDGGPVDQWLHEETEKIIRAYGNHPSMVLLAYGNEPSGKNRDGWLSDWVETWRARDPRRLYTTAAGWPALDVNDFQVIHAPRGAKGWGGRDYSREVASFEAPVVVHEMGQWCVFPNFDEIPKYTGSLKPHNFEIARDFLDRNGMLDQWRDFLRASGKLQALCYKEEIEAAFRTPGISGVQLLDLHDFPGQGTALVGVLDAFWGEKGYISPSQFRRFYDVTVPLARMEKRTWSRDETFVANLELAHFGPDELSEAALTWRVLDHQDQIVSRGKTIPHHVTQGRVDGLGEIRLPLKKWKAPAAYRLVVGVEGTSYENDWTWWVYPEASPGSGGSQILVTRQLNEEALARLGAGGKVLLTGAGLGPRHPRNSFPPIFWNRFMFASQRTQTLGLLCDPSHPALARFPTSFHSDWQWEPLLSQSKAVVMDDLPRGLRPIVQVIDDWNTSRKLGLVFECRVGTGKLLVCTPDLSGDMSGRLVAGQLLHSLLDYMRSGEFAPETEVQEEVLVGLLQYMPASALVRLGAKVVTVSSEDKENTHLGIHAIDGDPETFWHTRWQPGPDPMPHELVIDLGRTVSLSGITALQRQDMKNGWVKGFEVYVRTGSVTESWGEALVRGEMSLSEQLQTNSFPQTVEARFLKLRVMSEGNGNPFTALTELDVVLVP